MIKYLKKIKKTYLFGKQIQNDKYYLEAEEKYKFEFKKTPTRTEILNFIVQFLDKDDLKYLEIGVRNPEDNFNKINVKEKYSVDPGVEFKINPVDFKITSDDFFEKLKEGRILNKDIKFNLIFIDGLHLANQVKNDILNAMLFLDDNGFIVLHDCNPPTEIHAREDYHFRTLPTMRHWNGTTWKAFFKYRQNKNFFSCCIDTDWGVGVISKKLNIGNSTDLNNEFYEYSILDRHRKESLNLITFDEFKNILNKKI